MQKKQQSRITVTSNDNPNVSFTFSQQHDPEPSQPFQEPQIQLPIQTMSHGNQFMMQSNQEPMQIVDQRNTHSMPFMNQSNMQSMQIVNQSYPQLQSLQIVDSNQIQSMYPNQMLPVYYPTHPQQSVHSMYIPQNMTYPFQNSTYLVPQSQQMPVNHGTENYIYTPPIPRLDNSATRVLKEEVDFKTEYPANCHPIRLETYHKGDITSSVMTQLKNKPGVKLANDSQTLKTFGIKTVDTSARFALGSLFESLSDMYAEKIHTGINIEEGKTKNLNGTVVHAAHEDVFHQLFSNMHEIDIEDHYKKWVDSRQQRNPQYATFGPQHDSDRLNLVQQCYPNNNTATLFAGTPVTTGRFDLPAPAQSGPSNQGPYEVNTGLPANYNVYYSGTPIFEESDYDQSMCQRSDQIDTEESGQMPFNPSEGNGQNANGNSHSNIQTDDDILNYENMESNAFQSGKVLVNENVVVNHIPVVNVVNPMPFLNDDGNEAMVPLNHQSVPNMTTETYSSSKRNHTAPVCTGLDGFDELLGMSDVAPISDQEENNMIPNDLGNLHIDQLLDVYSDESALSDTLMLMD